MRPTEVFLSHSSHDRGMADRLARVLFEHGVPAFYSPINIVGAQQWHDEIGAALARCDWFLLLLTPESVRSKWVKRELLHALQNDKYDGHIVPLILRSCAVDELSWTLPQLQMIDFSQDFKSACQELLRIWGIGLRTDSLS